MANANKLLCMVSHEDTKDKYNKTQKGFWR